MTLKVGDYVRALIDPLTGRVKGWRTPAEENQVMSDEFPTREDLGIVSSITYGMGSSKTAAQNLAALKLAIAATPTRGTLVIPDDGGVMTIDTTGGLSNAAVVNKRMVIRIDGAIQSNFGTEQANPPYIFHVTGDRVTITGEGSIAGPGTINDANTGDETTFPGLIYVTGDKFKCTVDTIDTPPKLGILLYDCADAIISVRNWQGGPTSYTIGNTSYFGVRATGGGKHKITGNGMNTNASGGKLITLFFTGGLAGVSNDNEVSNNKGTCWEKVCYLNGDRNFVFGNDVRDALVTDIIRIAGSNNRVFGNFGFNITGGVTVNDGTGNEVENNTFRKVQQIGVNVARLSGSYTGGFTGTKVNGNRCYGDGASAGLTDGIRLTLDGLDSTDIEVRGNTVQNFAPNSGEALIRVRCTTAHSISNLSLKENVVSDTARAAFICDRVVSSEIASNQARNVAGFMFTETNSGNNRYANNKGSGIGSIGISGLASTSRGEGNQYGDAPISGLVTLAAAATTTVTHGGVAPNARILLQAYNPAAGAIQAVTGLIPAVSGTNFTISTGNGGAVGGTESFFYRIEQ